METWAGKVSSFSTLGAKLWISDYLTRTHAHCTEVGQCLTSDSQDPGAHTYTHTHTQCCGMHAPQAVALIHPGASTSSHVHP